MAVKRALRVLAKEAVVTEAPSDGIGGGGALGMLGGGGALGILGGGGALGALGTGGGGGGGTDADLAVVRLMAAGGGEGA